MARTTYPTPATLWTGEIPSEVRCVVGPVGGGAGTVVAGAVAGVLAGREAGVVADPPAGHWVKTPLLFRHVTLAEARGSESKTDQTDARPKPTMNSRATVPSRMER
jgi:hypothetical protein